MSVVYSAPILLWFPSLTFESFLETETFAVEGTCLAGRGHQTRYSGGILTLCVCMVRQKQFNVTSLWSSFKRLHEMKFNMISHGKSNLFCMLNCLCCIWHLRWNITRFNSIEIINHFIPQWIYKTFILHQVVVIGFCNVNCLSELSSI